MVVRSSSEIWDSIRESYENVTPGERKDFTRELESVLRELICRNLREDIPADIEVRTHRCWWCGLELDRDLNASINIL